LIDTKRNVFDLLEQKLEVMNGYIDISTAVDFSKIRERLMKEQYDRYTHSYMKMLTHKKIDISQSKLNPYAKNLLQDEIKMRNIIDFSKR